MKILLGLLNPFEMDEVKRTIFDMKEDTAPGLDGFTVGFYKNC